MTQIPVKIFPTLNTRECHMALLDALLDKEDRYFSDRRNKGIFGFQKGPGLVIGRERKSAVRWVCWVSRSLRSGRLGPDTLCLSVAFLDEILSVTRVESKYLYCLCLTALNLAAKLCEEPELVPCLADLNRDFCGSRYSIQELSRMERVLLTRLRWKLTYPTIESFIQLMLAISLIPQEVSAHLLQARDAPTDLRSSLEAVLASHNISATCNDQRVCIRSCGVSEFGSLDGGSGSGSAGFRPSLLALAMVSLALEARGYPHWFGIMVTLQHLFKVDACDVIKCREAVSGVLMEEMDKENETGLRKARSPRKRVRQRSKGSHSSSVQAKVKTPLEHIFVDEIADVAWI